MAEPRPYPLHGILVLSLPGQGGSSALTSHYFDPNADHGEIRDRLTHWFSLWGIPVGHTANFATDLEESFFETVWCSEVPQHLHGPQTVRYYAANGEKVLDTLREYRPRVIIVLSAYLYEALASEVMASRVTAVIGKALGPARRITAQRLKAMEQRFEHCLVLVLPTPSKNTTDDYVRSLTAPVREALSEAGFELDEAPDTLSDAAKALLVLDEKATLQKWENQLRIEPERALSLLKALVKQGIISAPDEKGRRFVKRLP